MEFSVSRDQGAFEWASKGLDAIFCQRSNIFSPGMWRLLFDIVRFNQFALDVIIGDDDGDLYSYVIQGPKTTRRRKGSKKESIAQYLAREDYSETFQNDYLLPMVAAIWGIEPGSSSFQFPIETLVRFM